MKFTNTLRKVLANNGSSAEFNNSSTITDKSDNFFHNSFSKLFQRKGIPIVIETTSYIEEITEIEFIGEFMSEDDFMDLLPANGYFH